MIKHQYHVDIRWSEEDKAFIARVPELDLVTHGDSSVEATKHAEEAIQLHLKSLKKHGEQAPDPISKRKLSGKFPLRMSIPVHEDATLRAERLGQSLNEYINSLIEQDLIRRGPAMKSAGHRKSSVKTTKKRS